MAEYTNYADRQLSDFFADHMQQGQLRVQVTTGRGTFPVPGAQVEVLRRFDGMTQFFYQGVTDESGVAEGIRLPARPAAWSQSSERADESDTSYLVNVRHPLFLPVTERAVNIYPQVESILSVALEPIL